MWFSFWNQIFLLVAVVLGIIALVVAWRSRRVSGEQTDRVQGVESKIRALERGVESLKSLVFDQGRRLKEIEARLAAVEPIEIEEEVAARYPAAEEPKAVEIPPEPSPPAAEPPERPVSPLLRPEGVPPPGARSAQPVAESPPWWENFEETVGKRWMTWAGALALFLSVAFFLKYAFDNQWLGPTGRVVLGIGFGLCLLIAGDVALRREMRALGQGLIGGGLAVLYLSLFAAFSFYQLISQGPAFASMVLVTAAGVALAVLHDALPLCFLAVLGGFLSPLLVKTGLDPRDGLFAYLTLLNVGVLATALFKRWRSLDILAFAGTWVMYSGWFTSFYRAEALAPAMLWVAAFYTIFLVLPFVYQLRQRVRASIEQYVIALVNALIAFGYAYLLLRMEHPYTLGFLALAMSASYLALAVLSRERVPEDDKSLFGFVTLAVAFLTMAIPLQLKLHGITLAWAIEGPVLLYLGYRFSYLPVRIGGLVVLALAVGRLFLFHWPLHRELYVLILNKSFLSAMFVPAALAGYAVIHQWWRSEGEEIDDLLKTGSAIAAGFITLIILDNEIGVWAVRTARSLAHPSAEVLGLSVRAYVWIIGACCFCAAGVRTKVGAAWVTGIVALSIAMIVCFAAYAASMNEPYYLFLNARFVAAAGTAFAVLASAFMIHRHGAELSPGWNSVAKWLYAAGGLLLLVVLSLETYTYCHETIRPRATARWTAQMSLSIVWGIYALGALGIGFWLRVRELRLAALGLLGITCVKLVLVDLAQVHQVYRIVSFVALGLAMILASFLYHRLEKRIERVSG